MKLVILLAVCLASLPSAFAECWTIENLSGYSAKGFNAYRITADGLRGKRFHLTLSGKDSSMSPSHGMSCAQTAPLVLLCSGPDGSGITIETWALDISMKKAYYTQMRSGYGPLDGANLFVGEVTGRCE